MYLPASSMARMMEQHKFTGQAWQYRLMWKTYRPAGGMVYKSLEGLNPHNEEDFWNIMGSNYRAGIPPPSSYAAIFHRVCKLKWPKKSVVAPFRAYTCGAWSQALTVGTFHEKMYHYDLVSAYRWAACQGLPVLGTAKRVYDLDAERSMFLVEFDDVTRPAYVKAGIKEGMMTSEELRGLQIRPRLIYGMQFRDWLDMTGLFAEITKRFPWCYKRISRAFWGRWNGETDVQQHGWKQGHRVRQLPNPLHNPIWSHFITSRVKLRLLEAIRSVGVVHVQVDGILCREPLPVSEEPGGWQLKEEYPRGLFVDGTGRWGSGEILVRRMGLNAREAEQWQRLKKS